jgi:hypothetical protein
MNSLLAYTFEKVCDSQPNIVLYSSDLVHRQAFLVFERPIIAVQPRHIRTLVATTHCDEEGEPRRNC